MAARHGVTGLAALILTGCGSQATANPGALALSAASPTTALPTPSSLPEDSDATSAHGAGRGIVEGLVWADLDVDGEFDDGEPGVGDVEVVLRAGGVEETVRTTFSVDTTNFVFADVPAGEATLTAILDGWTTPAAVDVIIADGESSRVNFGSDVGSLVGAAWFDEDDDGIRDADEEPASGLSLSVLRGASPYSSVIERVTGEEGAFRLPAARAQYATMHAVWTGDRSQAPVPVGAAPDSVSLFWLASGFGESDAAAHGFFPRDPQAAERCAGTDRRTAQCLLPDITGAGVAVVRPSFDHEVRTRARNYTALVGQPLAIGVAAEPVGPYIAAVYDVFVTMGESLQLTTTPVNICNPAGGGPSGDPVIPCEDLAPFVDPNWYVHADPTPPFHLSRGDHLYPPCPDPPCHPYDPFSGPNEPLVLTVVPTAPGEFEVAIEVPTTKFGFSDRNPANNRVIVTIDVLDALPGTS